MRTKLIGLVCVALVVCWAALALAQSSELERTEHRTTMGSVLIGPDPSVGGAISVWFVESGNGDLFWIEMMKNLPPKQQQFFQEAFNQGRFINIEGDFEWWGEGNVIRKITRLKMS